MSLTPCPECGGQLSTKARACPHCGWPAAWMRNRGKLVLWASRSVLILVAAWLMLAGVLVPVPGFLLGAALVLALFAASYRWPNVAAVSVFASAVFVLFAWTAPTWF